MARAQDRTPNHGFNLIELITIMAIVAIVALYAIPRYQHWQHQRTLNLAVDTLLVDLHYARAEAIHLGQRIVL